MAKSPGAESILEGVIPADGRSVTDGWNPVEIRPYPAAPGLGAIKSAPPRVYFGA